MHLVRLLVVAILINSAGIAETTLAIGLLTDGKCGETHKDVTEAEAPRCVRTCVKAGAHYVLKTMTSMYQISNQDFKDLDKYAGKIVMMQGTVQGNNFIVSSVSPAPNIGSH